MVILGDNKPQSAPQSNGVTVSSVCVFCGSGLGQDPSFQHSARQLGAFLAKEGLHLIYGGGDMGLMGTISEATLTHNGKVTGIIPEFLLKYQKPQNPDQVHPNHHQIVTQTMHERKAKMYELADAFIALPGGIGTLEELVETMTWEQLGQHKKPIILLNTNQFWNPFLDLLKHMKHQAFIRPGLEVNFHIEENIANLSAIFSQQSKNMTQ